MHIKLFASVLKKGGSFLKLAKHFGLFFDMLCEILWSPFKSHLYTASKEKRDKDSMAFLRKVVRECQENYPLDMQYLELINQRILS